MNLLGTRKNKITKKEYFQVDPEAWDKILAIEIPESLRESWPMFGSLVDHYKANKTMDEWLKWLMENYVDEDFIDYEPFNLKHKKNSEIDHDYMCTVLTLKLLSDQQKNPSIFNQDGIEINQIKKYTELLQTLLCMEYFVHNMHGLIQKNGTYDKFGIEKNDHKVTYQVKEGAERIENKDGSVTMKWKD